MLKKVVSQSKKILCFSKDICYYENQYLRIYLNNEYELVKARVLNLNFIAT